MVSIAITMVIGAVLNATDFTGSMALAKSLEGKHVDEERIRHDKALEAYQKAMGDFQKKREEYQDWLNTEYVAKKQAEENMGYTDMAFKLYAKTHPDAHRTLSRKPEFGDFYKPSGSQKKYEMVYVGGGMLIAGAVASRFL